MTSPSDQLPKNMSPPLSTLRDGAKNNTRTQQLQAVRDQASSCLAGLEPLRLEHLPLIKESLTAGEQHAWGYYFPFLLWLSQTKSRSLLWAKMDGSLCLFVENYGIPQHLDLYAPPLPTNGQVLGRCLERANDYNGDLSARIYWIDEKDAAALQEVPGLRLQVKEQEYLYCPHDLRNLSGGAYRTLRHNLRQATENADLEIRPYGPDDSPGCLRLLNDWEHGQGLKYEVLRGGSYTRACFAMEPLLPDQDLRGEVILVAGQIRAFAFGGEIRPGLGCFFLAKSDVGIRGLSYLSRHHFLSGMNSCGLVNDSSDEESPGLRQLKRMLRPRGMHTVYKAKQRY